MRKDFICESIEFGLEFPAHILAGQQSRIAGNPFGSRSTKPFELIARWMDLKDIGPLDLRVKLPYAINRPWVSPSIVVGNETFIVPTKSEDFGFIEEPQEGYAAGADEGGVDPVFVSAFGFAEDEDGFHGAIRSEASLA